MLVIAHRGASAERPENTMAAFARAVEVGADMIELDVRATVDSVLYVAHDEVTVGGKPRRAAPRPPSWGDVRALAGASGRYPSLADVLDALAPRIALNLEVKEARAAPLLLEELRRRELADGILLSSFDLRVAGIFRDRAAHVQRAYLANRLPLRLGARLAALGAATFHPRLSLVTPLLLARARRAGVATYVWTVDDPLVQRRLQGWGVDGVFTNDPGQALRALGRR